MRENATGYVVVVELEPLAHPVGVLTDHDIAVKVVAGGMDPKTARVSDIMTANPIITALESDPTEAAFQKMLELGLRRVPVVNERRELVGILVMDDLYKVMSTEAQQLINVIRKERRLESVKRAERYVAIRQAGTSHQAVSTAVAKKQPTASGSADRAIAGS
jgi:signal-transduction protein with cAMP-binding, CBS, and nucleotidyltransferase domain